MSKIKINVSNGTVLEKPLVTAFKGSYGTYMVLDDERTGNMGLPVILVCKIQDNKVTNIMDPNEWNAVKESLRNLINGIQTDYISVGTEYSADENYCSQLTLPVDYFDNLKNNYKPVDGISLESTPLASDVGPVDPAAPVGDAPVMPDVPVSSPIVEEPVPPVAAPEMPTPPAEATPVVEPVAPETPNPADAAPVMPEVPTPDPTPAPVEAPTVEAPTPDVNPLQSVALNAPTPPAVEPVPEAQATPNVDFSQDKEAFLKACENMFDALVAKFTNK